MLSVTKAIESPKERAILSMTFICLKKTSVQAKPGKTKTITDPSTALRTGKRARKGKRDSNISLIESTAYVNSPLIFGMITG